MCPHIWVALPVLTPVYSLFLLLHHVSWVPLHRTALYWSRSSLLCTSPVSTVSCKSMHTWRPCPGSGLLHFHSFCHVSWAPTHRGTQFSISVTLVLLFFHIYFPITLSNSNNYSDIDCTFTAFIDSCGELSVLGSWKLLSHTDFLFWFCLLLKKLFF